MSLLIDRLILKPDGDSTRLREALNNGFQLAKALNPLSDETQNSTPQLTLFNLNTENQHAAELTEREVLNPNQFSFNHPLGACPTCEGFGRIIGLDLTKVIPNKQKSLEDGAVHPFTTPAHAELQDDLFAEARKKNVRLDVPYDELTDDEKSFILNGSGAYPGVYPFFDWLESKRYKVHVRVMLAKYRGYYDCPDCLGSRLRADTLNIQIQGKNILNLCSIPVKELLPFFEALSNSDSLSDYERNVSDRLFKEILSRLRYLNHVGLGYLTLGRQTRTLSGGEAQRIKLVTQLSRRRGPKTMYLLDEPTTGLHFHDVARLLDVFAKLRDAGNTLVVIEHNLDVIKSADWLVDLGPEGGSGGGRVVVEGPPEYVAQCKESFTGQFLKRYLPAAKPKKRSRKKKAA